MYDGLTSLISQSLVSKSHFAMVSPPFLKRHMQSQTNNAIGDKFNVLSSQGAATQSVAEHGIKQDVIPLAIKEYKGSNVAATVHHDVETAVQQYDHSVNELYQALLQVVLHKWITYI
ncbi:hypothetical protein EV401DRAFT_1893626 [Pisolithus croceorrhizus]|nr:hypothetical protein EV401DRAFT_1893626 [Pisolithus croceorrhizus]